MSYKVKHSDTMAIDTKQGIFLIGMQGRVITDTGQLKKELCDVINEGTIYKYAKAGLNKNTLHKLKNQEIDDPRFSTVLKLLKAAGKKIVIVDEGIR